MVGYWNNLKATAGAIVDGWLDIVDVMSVNEDSYLLFHGRNKQIIVHDGSNICPQEVEAALLEHDAVASAGVISVRSAMQGEKVRASVTLDRGEAPPTMRELIQFAPARVGYKAPEEVIVLDTMPLNATGKVDRVSLKRTAEQGLEALRAQRLGEQPFSSEAVCHDALSKVALMRPDRLQLHRSPRRAVQSPGNLRHRHNIRILRQLWWLFTQIFRLNSVRTLD